jgi:hypothetical protein
MPFLDAKALETDPEGMAFLRAVIRPRSRRRKAAPRPAQTEKGRDGGASQPCQTEVQQGPEGSNASAPLETA